MAPMPAIVSLLVFSASSSVPAAFQCYSDIDLGPVESIEKKGLALDDSTLRGCPSKIPALWPNADAPVKTLRLFKAWSPEWPEDDREPTWKALASFAHSQKAKVLVGTQITCDQTKDDQDWAWVKQLLRTLDKDHVMGVAIGNELDILYAKPGTAPECIKKLWEGGRLWANLQKRVADLDAMGFAAVPVTSVFTSAVLGGAKPFQDTPHAMVNTFLTQAVAKYASRFVFTFNFYPYFDPNFQPDAGTTSNCSQALKVATCFSGGCSMPSVPAIIRAVKGKMQQLTGSTQHKLWVGETGWSSPLSQSLKDTGNAMAQCPAWSSSAALRAAYDGFLDWNLDAAGADVPDHAFYFTVRDSMNFGVSEKFGLMSKCWVTTCKLRSAGYKGPTEEELRRQRETERMSWVAHLWLGLGAGSVAAILLFAGCAWCCRSRESAGLDGLTDVAAADAAAASA